MYLKYRKERYLAQRFPSKRPFSVHPKKRMAYLQMHRNTGFYDPSIDAVARRRAFAFFKSVSLPALGKVPCYIVGCEHKAEEWHHVVHIMRGGIDHKRNLVPLCKSHHKQAHRHDPVRKNRLPYLGPKLGVVHTTKPIEGVVVVPKPTF